jgi:hypothetical protein
MSQNNNNTTSQEKPKAPAPQVDKASLAESIKTHEAAKNTNQIVKK